MAPSSRDQLRLVSVNPPSQVRTGPGHRQVSVSSQRHGQEEEDDRQFTGRSEKCSEHGLASFRNGAVC